MVCVCANPDSQIAGQSHSISATDYHKVTCGQSRFAMLTRDVVNKPHESSPMLRIGNVRSPKGVDSGQRKVNVPMNTAGDSRPDFQPSTGRRCGTIRRDKTIARFITTRCFGRRFSNLRATLLRFSVSAVTTSADGVRQAACTKLLLCRRAFPVGRAPLAQGVDPRWSEMLILAGGRSLLLGNACQAPERFSEDRFPPLL